MNTNQKNTRSEAACSNERTANDTNWRKFKAYFVKQDIGSIVIEAKSLADAISGAKEVHIEDIEHWKLSGAQLVSVDPIDPLAEEFTKQPPYNIVDDTSEFSQFMAKRRFYERLFCVLVGIALCLSGFVICVLRF